MTAIDMDQYGVVVTFKDGHQLTGRCTEDISMIQVKKVVE